MTVGETMEEIYCSVLYNRVAPIIKLLTIYSPFPLTSFELMPVDHWIYPQALLPVLAIDSPTGTLVSATHTNQLRYLLTLTSRVSPSFFVEVEES